MSVLEPKIRINDPNGHRGSDVTDDSSLTQSSLSTTMESDETPLRFKASDIPPWKQSILLGLQQTMVTIGGCLVTPFIISGLMCAGPMEATIRAKLISVSFVVTGFSTLLQTVFGLRLAVLQGPSSSFIPALIAFLTTRKTDVCHDPTTGASPEYYYDTLNTINGSLAASSVLLLLAGMTGFVGTLSRLIGPVTVFPLLTLIAVETVDIVVQKASQHWISVVAFIVLMVCVVFLAEVNVPIPYWTNGRYTPIQYPLFSQFPYIIAIVSTWLLALVLSLTNTFDENSPARVNTKTNMETIKEAAWFSIPHPGAFGGYAVSPGLLLGFIAACIASIAESIGGYGVLAKISQEPYPTSSTLNRSIIMEGLGTLFGGLCGMGVGMTTYSENIAAVSITRVASRFTMQLGAIFLVLLGVFSKIGAILATIPDPMIGGVLGVSMAMIIGVAVSNLDLINLKRSRNITIIGIAMILGLGIPAYVIKLETAGQFPSVGVKDIDDTIMMLLKLKMFVGGLIAFILDNLCGGATLRERGFRHLGEDKPAVGADGFSFPAAVNRFLLRPHFNLLLRLPFIPSKKELEAILEDQENPKNTQTA